MDVKIFNSLTNKVEVLKPIKEGQVSIYCCGPTVYGDAHVGNIRPPIVFDTFSRFLTHLGYEVKFVSNFTDVDDKIINRALKEGVSEAEITDKYISAYRSVLESLNVKKAYKNPRVTEYMGEIISYIDDLVKNGSAYNVDGDVFFRVSSVPHYGELANVNIDDLMVGARIEENSKKESPLDFALWKKTEAGIKWDSPWGKGRPGWHTECCVMIDSIFGNEKIDIHGGGFDLKFPHHENEIAQAKAHDHNKLANIWMHNGFVNFGDEKMSKSLGNVVLAKDAIAKYGANAMRLLILTTHYRAPVQFTEETITSTQNELARISKTFSQLAVSLQVNNIALDAKKDIDLSAFLNYLADDFNTANAMTELFNVLKQSNQDLRKNPLDLEAISKDFSTLKTMLDIFGLDIKYPLLSEEDKEIYHQYLAYKAQKDFENSDKLRNILISKNIL